MDAVKRLRGVEVAVAAPLFSTLTYLPPEGRENPIRTGQRLLVPLGRRTVTGYVLDPDTAVPLGMEAKRIMKREHLLLT